MTSTNFVDTLEITQKYDAAVLSANIENWASLLGPGLTPETRFVEISKAQGEWLLKSYEATERQYLAVEAAAKEFVNTGKMDGYLNPYEQQLMEQLGPGIQKAIDELSEGLEKKGCFVKTSSVRSFNGLFHFRYSSWAAVRIEVSQRCRCSFGGLSTLLLFCRSRFQRKAQTPIRERETARTLRQ